MPRFEIRSGFITALILFAVVCILALATIPLITSNTRSVAYAEMEQLARGTTPRAHLRDYQRRYAEPDYIRDTRFRDYGASPFISTDLETLSTFGLDVDTASFGYVSNALRIGGSIQPSMVRAEEFINALEYDYTNPVGSEVAIDAAAAEAPLLNKEVLLRFGICARAETGVPRPRVLTVVVDTSGSMDGEKLSCAKQYLHALANMLRNQDRLAIVEFSNEAEVAIHHRSASELETLRKAINGLDTHRSTNVEAGLELAYKEATTVYDPRALNRVILLSDGVANVMHKDPDGILAQTAKWRERDIFLTTIGIGLDTYNDVMLERLAQKGMGQYIHLNSTQDVLDVMGLGLAAHLDVALMDARAQVEFNSEVVESFRLIGYENRAMQHSEFEDMNIFGAVLAPGQEVTVLYEVRLKHGAAGAIATLTLRHKPASKHFARSASSEITTEQVTDWNGAPESLKLATCAAELAEVLRNGSLASKRRFAALDQELGTLAGPGADKLKEVVRRARPAK